MECKVFCPCNQHGGAAGHVGNDTMNHCVLLFAEYLDIMMWEGVQKLCISWKHSHPRAAVSSLAKEVAEGQREKPMRNKSIQGAASMMDYGN